MDQPQLVRSQGKLRRLRHASRTMFLNFKLRRNFFLSLLRLSALLFVPIIIFFAEVKASFFPNVSVFVDLAIVLGPSVFFLNLSYFLYCQNTCPKCEKNKVGSNFWLTLWSGCQNCDLCANKKNND